MLVVYPTSWMTRSLWSVIKKFLDPVRGGTHVAADTWRQTRRDMTRHDETRHCAADDDDDA